MGRIKEKTSETKRNTRKMAPARTAEERENQLINLAMALAEEQLRDGSATSQVITYFLKLAGLKERLENEKLRADVQLANAKIEQIQQSADIKVMYEEALAAMKDYSGQGSDEDYDDYEVF